MGGISAEIPGPVEPILPADPTRPLRLCTAADPVEAALIRSTLAWDGVQAVTEGEELWENLWQLLPSVLPLGLPILVRQADLGFAREILAEIHSGSLSAYAGESDAGDEVAEQTYESKADRDVIRAFRMAVIFSFGAVIFTFGFFGIFFCPYSMCLLWHARSAWNEPDPRIRRRCRRRMVIAWGLNAVGVVFLMVIFGAIIQSLHSISLDFLRLLRGLPDDFVIHG